MVQVATARSGSPTRSTASQTDYEGGRQTPELPPRVYRLDPRDRRAARWWPTTSTGPTGSAFSPDERRLYVAETGDQFDDGSRSSTSACSTSPTTAAGCHGGASSTRSRPATPTASAATRTAMSGRAPATACTASPRTARCSARSWCRTAVSNLCFGGRSAAGCSSAPASTLYAVASTAAAAQRP